MVAAGFGSGQGDLEYDHLVVALGNVTSFRGAPGLAEHALPFKYLGDALTIRNHVIHALEEADVEPAPEVRQQLAHLRGGGGRLLGRRGGGGAERLRAEGGAELPEHRSRPDSGRAPPRGGSHPARAAPEPGPLRPEDPHEARRGDPLQDAPGRRDGRHALLEGGARIGTKTLVSTVPAEPQSAGGQAPVHEGARASRRRRRPRAARGTPDVWALGDCAWILDSKTGEPCPPTAQHAIRQARCLAHNLVASLRGETPRPSTFPALGKMGSLGHRSAVAEVFGVEALGLPGLVAVAHGLPHEAARASTARSAWRLRLDARPDPARPTSCSSRPDARSAWGASTSSRRGHRREGDRGDRLYVVVDGEVEVVREGAERGSPPLIVLGPGDSFGEIALVRGGMRTATVRARTPVNVLTACSSVWWKSGFAPACRMARPRSTA